MVGAAPVVKIATDTWPIYDSRLLHVGISNFFSLKLLLTNNMV